jgi:hypothetical protein
MWDPKIAGMAWESFPGFDQTDFADSSSFPNGGLRGVPMENYNRQSALVRVILSEEHKDRPGTRPWGF